MNTQREYAAHQHAYNIYGNTPTLFFSNNAKNTQYFLHCSLPSLLFVILGVNPRTQVIPPCHRERMRGDPVIMPNTPGLPRSFHSLAMTRVFTLLSPLVIAQLDCRTQVIPPCHRERMRGDPVTHHLVIASVAWRSSHLALLFTGLPRSFHSLAMTRVLFFPVSFWCQAPE